MSCPLAAAGRVCITALRSVATSTSLPCPRPALLHGRARTCCPGLSHRVGSSRRIAVWVRLFTFLARQLLRIWPPTKIFDYEDRGVIGETQVRPGVWWASKEFPHLLRPCLVPHFSTSRLKRRPQSISRASHLVCLGTPSLGSRAPSGRRRLIRAPEKVARATEYGTGSLGLFLLSGRRVSSFTPTMCSGRESRGERVS